MTYRLGVDVGGTFTDVLLIDERSGGTYRAKTASTPDDQSVGVLRGIEKVCGSAGITLADIAQVLHGTTVATNAILEGKGARVGLVTTQGFRQVLQIARSFVPGGLAGWIIWPKPEPLAALEDTVEAIERIAADGSVVTAAGRRRHPGQAAHPARGRRRGADDLADQLLRQRRARAADRGDRGGGTARRPALGVQRRCCRSCASTSAPSPPSRTATSTRRSPATSPAWRASWTTAAYRPACTSCAATAAWPAPRTRPTARSRCCCPARPAAWPARPGPPSRPATGTSSPSTWAAPPPTWRWCRTCCRGSGGRPRSATSRCGPPRWTCGPWARAAGPSRTCPPLTRALRVGPQSAGAVPGPAAYRMGGTEPTVTDANVVLGYLPTELAGGEITLDAQAAQAAVKTIADAMELGSVEAAAAGIVDIVNENMFGALRLVSVQQGFDPRDFALVAFGGAGPLHANALGKLTGAWPVIVPPSPGVLCAYGDATTMVRDEAARTYIRTFGAISDDELLGLLHELAEAAAATARGPGRARASEQATTYQVDLRYHGQGFEITVAGRRRGLRRPRRRAGRAGGRVRRRAQPAVLVPARGQRARAGQRARHRHRPAPRRRHGPAARRRPPIPSAALARTTRIWVDGGHADDGRLRPDRAAGRATWSPARPSSPRWTPPRSSCPATPPPCIPAAASSSVPTEG